MARAALRSERLIALVRIALAVVSGACGVAQFGLLRQVGAFELAGLSQLLLMGGGVAWSVYMLRRGASERPSWRRDLYVSALVDVALILWLNADLSFLHPQDGVAMVARPENGIFLVALIAAGCRFVKPVVWLGVASLVVVEAGSVGVDIARHGWAATGVATMVWLQLAAMISVFAIGLGARTRALVFEGARAVLHAERARRRMGAYLAEAVAEEALASDEVVLGGERRTVGILFSDLRGFTAQAERLDPAQLVTELNAYLGEMMCEIRAEGGVIDKFMGDAIMVVFGAHATHPDPAGAAIRAAVRMRAALARHNRDRHLRGLEPLRHGIGVHHGEVVAGHVGDLDRMQHTVIGDVVNVASRLEKATKTLGVDIAISEAAVVAAQARRHGAVPELQCLGGASLPGRVTAICVYTPTARDLPERERSRPRLEARAQTVR